MDSVVRMEKSEQESIDFMTSSDDIEIFTQFDQMGLSEIVLRGIFSAGFEIPSPIQQRATVPCARGRDCIIQAQSGTGKTATFSIAVVERVLQAFQEKPIHTCRGIILSPTRELATQSHSVLSDLVKYSQLSCKALVGGRNVRDNINDIREGADIVVGTPGRVLHLMEDHHLSLDHLLMLVLDEADEMLSKGFRDSMSKVISLMPSTGQIVLVSATLPKEVLALAQKFLMDPFRILVNRTELSLSGINQYYVTVKPEEKLDALKTIYTNLVISKAVVFCNSIPTVKILHDTLKNEKFPVELMHGQMEQSERDRVISEFRSDNCRLLVSSDLLSRGLDLQHINLVINYDVPNDRQSYLHRIGRSGRYGRKGTAINFVTNEDMRILSDIQEHYAITIQQLPQSLEL